VRKLEFILRRLLSSIFVLLGVSIITFALSRVVPTNAAVLYIGPRAKPEDIARVTKLLGLDKPLPVQYAIYMRDLLHGDFGTSIATKRPIIKEIADRAPASLELLITGMSLAVIVGIPLGVLSARWQGKPIDIVTRAVSIIGVSIPAFYLGLVLQIIFFRNLNWLPLTGQLNSDIRFTSPVEAITNFIILDALITKNWVALKDALIHIILPAITLAAYPMGLIARMTRASMLEVLEQDYIRTARAYGIRDYFITYFYALKNAIGPSLTVIGLTVAYLLTGTFFVEVIFTWPGLGLFTVTALLNVDYPAIMGVTLFGASAYVIINSIVDLLQAAIDPRINL
jgi:ABC-type dipeptide/oligopeptide/nickel transport system permease component